MADETTCPIDNIASLLKYKNAVKFKHIFELGFWLITEYRCCGEMSRKVKSNLREDEGNRIDLLNLLDAEKKKIFGSQNAILDYCLDGRGFKLSCTWGRLGCFSDRNQYYNFDRTSKD